jgi:exodeoxyribonuclease V alpha subunit
MIIDMYVQVTSVRSQDPKGFGGCIFSCKFIEINGDVQDTKAYFVVKATRLVLGGAYVQLGQCWKIRGDVFKRTLTVNGYKVSERQIEAHKANLIRPWGSSIISFIAENPAFQDVGYVKAQKLWRTFGTKLFTALDSLDVGALASLLTPESAAQTQGAWVRCQEGRISQWLLAEGIQLKIVSRVLAFFGHETEKKLSDDPYRLLSFYATWHQVDSFAKTHFKVADDDPRRLQGAIEEASYRAFAIGHTIARSSELLDYLKSILGTQTKSFQWRDLVVNMLTKGLTNGGFVVRQHGIQPVGAFFMERQVALAVTTRIAKSSRKNLLSSSEVESVICSYEVAEKIQLSADQRQAAHFASNNAFLLVIGGSCVGKTTIVKALCKMYDQAGVEVIQLAMSARAAILMQDVTGRKASSISNFLWTCKPEHISKPSVVVVDEASMLDIISMYLLCEALPLNVRMVLVGDPMQLMPVGPGLVLHALTNVPQVPLVELKVVKLCGHIASAAKLILEGQWPDFKEMNPSVIGFTARDPRVAFDKCESIPKEVLRLYLQDPKNTQIICTRRNGIDGIKMLNSLCQKKMTAENAPVTVWSQQHGTAVGTGFNLGDPIICNQNMPEMGLQNGSLGLIVEIESVQKMITPSDGEQMGQVIAWVTWDDGVLRPLYEEMLDDLELSYAMTVYKARGSKWPRVIIPLSANRLLGRASIYTAVTRAQNQVLLVGDEAAAIAAVQKEPRVLSRNVALDLTVLKLLES